MYSLSLLSSQVIHRWGFKRGKREFLVDVSGGLIVSDRRLLVDCAAQGLGLAFVTDREAREHFEAGRLEHMLQAFIPRDSGMFLYFPERSQTQLELRVFIDMLKGIRQQISGSG